MSNYELGGITEPTEVIEVKELRDNTVRRGVGWKHRIYVSTTSETIKNNGTDSETININIINGLEIARGTDPSNATVLDYSGDVTLSIDGVETVKTLTDGSLSFDVTTEKPAGATIEIVAESVADHPAESDRVEIEVIQA